MKYDKKLELMQLAIETSKKSKAEDSRTHPLVGAVLADDSGNVIATSFRGEGNNGGHAEYNLLNKVEHGLTNPESCHLFVTLEPCTSRGHGKIPCAQRIVNTSIGNIYIGMLDPNIVICGKGELFLRRNCKSVERFPNKLVRVIEQINEKFCALFLTDHIPDNSLYVKKRTSDLLLDNLKKCGLEISFMPDGWDVTIKDITSHCLSQNPGKAPNLVKKAVLQARADTYDQKYLRYSYSKDSRGLNTNWISDFNCVLGELRINSLADYKTIVVGIGNGEEAPLYTGISDITVVDIGTKSLSKAKRKLKSCKSYCAPAEYLTRIPTSSMDAYISLRTYQSSYFDISSALREAHRVLARKGVLIISVANGFRGDMENIIPGLVIPGTNKVDHDRPYEVTNKIRKKLNDLGFVNLGTRTTIDGIYIYGEKAIQES